MARPRHLTASVPLQAAVTVRFLFLKIMGNSSEFQKAVKLVINTVSFDKDSTVQVFEATIR